MEDLSQVLTDLLQAETTEGPHFPRLKGWRGPVPGLWDEVRGTYLGRQVLTRAQAERLCSKAFLFSISPWEEVLPGDPVVSCQFLTTREVPSKLCGRGTIEHSQDRQAGIPDLCRQLLPEP